MTRRSTPLLPLLASLAILSGSLGCASPGSPSSPQAWLANTVDQIASSSMQQQGVPGMTVAVARNGTVLYAQGYGVSDLSSRSPAQPDVIFEIGSITKQFTAALIMKLQEQGRLHVEDSLTTYLPEYGFSSNITLRMLLTHTSGLANFTDFPQLGDWLKHGVSEATVLTAVSQAPLQFQPGTRYSYSNSNFFALGTIVEKVSGKAYPAILQEQILQPLKLRSTSYSLPPATQAATGYAHYGSGVVPAILWDRSAAFAAGAISSNVYDLVAWDNALMSGKVVSQASFQAMTAPNGFQIPGGGSYGFGLALWTYNGRPVIWHNGQIGGFTAETAEFPDSGFTVVVLTNDQDANPDDVVLRIMNAVCSSSQFPGGC